MVVDLLGWYCSEITRTPAHQLYVQDLLLLVQGTYYHLWFLYSLISIYHNPANSLRPDVQTGRFLN